MQVTKTITKLTDVSDCSRLITLGALSSPLLNADNRYRVALFRHGKECGTTMPLVLYYALKLKFIENMKAKRENDDVDAQLHHHMRRLLSDIQTLAYHSKKEETTLVSKTFQEKIFRHIVWDEPLLIDSADELLENNEVNRAHTVSGRNCPSCTIPSYLCRWVLEKDKMNSEGEYKRINSYIKQLARDTYQPLKNLDVTSWRPVASFSRRVQNMLFMRAFESAFSQDVLSIPLRTPE